jgi:hypothetical protein
MIQLVCHILTYNTIGIPHFDLWYNWYATFWLIIQWLCHILTYDTIGMPPVALCHILTYNTMGMPHFDL